MLIDPMHPDFEKTIVFLDDKVCVTAMAADDVEGWVEVVDLAAYAPPIGTIDETIKPENIDSMKTYTKEIEDTLAELDSQPMTEWEEVKTIRKYGKVEFKKI